MRFWETSAVVSLLIEQEATKELRPLFEDDPLMVAWWGTPVECASAAARLRREGVFTLEDEDSVLSLLGRFRSAWLEILPTSDVRDEAMRVLRVHSLRVGDALQLAAALIWSGRAREGELVTLDERLSHAARLEGFRVLP